MAKMDVLTLRTLVQSQKADALAATQSAKLTLERERAERYYMGDVAADLPAEEGRSQTVSTDVSDTIEGLMPHLMDIFAGSDEVVRFEPVGPDDEKAAQQETDYVNHVFMQQNPGFMILYAFIKDALLSKNGIVKIWWEEREEESKEQYYDLAEDQFAMVAQAVLQSNGKLELIEHTQNQTVTQGQDPQTGQPTQIPTVTHDITVLKTRKYAQAKVLGVPPEEFGIERNARDIKNCNYCFHEVVTKTRAELIAEGYDKTQIDSLPEYNGQQTAESLARDSVWEHSTGGDSSTNKAAQFVRITENYVRMDYEGNGKPMLYQVVTGGDQGEILKRDDKLSVEEYDEMPFASATPLPIAHRFFGRSIADIVIPVMKEKTALKRGALDNIYLAMSPRVDLPEAACGPDTIDDLLVSRPGGVVRTKGQGGMLQWQVVPDMTRTVFGGLQYLDAELESKTGVSRQSQGIDADALQNQSATAVNQVFSASQMRMKLIARVLAEGVRDMFTLLHATIRKHGEEAQTVRLRNQWVQVDPRNWKTRNDMTINVGLGTGGKAQQFAQIMALANMQKEFIAGGKGNMVPDDKLFNTAAEVVRIMGYKNPDRFFGDPSETTPDGQPKYPPLPPQEDPKVTAIKLKAQLDEQAAAHKAQLEQQKSQADAIHQQVKTAAEMELAKLKAQLDAWQTQMEASLKTRALDQEMRHAEHDHQLGVAETVLGMAHDHQKHAQSLELARQKPDKADA